MVAELEKSSTDVETNEPRGGMLKPDENYCSEKETSTSIELELQSPGFAVKVVPIAGDAFDIQVNLTELVQELHQVLMDREESCQFTCFSLHLNGQHMDNFSELKSFKDLKPGATIRVRHEPYSVREARVHVRHVRDLMCGGCEEMTQQEMYSGERGCSVSVLDHIIHESGSLIKQSSDSQTNQATSPKLSQKSNAECYQAPNQGETTESTKMSADITPGQFSPANQPLLPMIPTESQSQISITCLSELSMSHWNPVPNTRRLKGDLLYLKVKTLEGLEVGITACTRGFYLNRITDAHFDSTPSDDPNMSLTLVELLSKISLSFKKNFPLAQKKRVSRNVLTRVPTSLQHWSWIVPPSGHVADGLKAEDSWLYRLGYEEHILGQTRDWNEEIQSIREMSGKTKSERLTRERAMYKTYSDFLSAAVRGAVSVVDGNMMPINPGECRNTHMYIYNNIFFSLGFDVKEHYLELGGDAAAYVACNHDLKGVRAISEAAVQAEGMEGALYTLGTAIVDYRGYRVACQTIMPGVLDKEQEESVVHGSIDFGKKIVSHEAYGPKLEKIAHELKSRPHIMCGEVEANDGSSGQGEGGAKEHLVHVSTECKGIIGNDGRHYLLDLLRLFPPDVNFMPDLEDGEELDESVKQKGFPRKHPHKLPQLRSELVEAFVDSRYLAFVSHATSMVLKQKNNTSSCHTNSPSAPITGDNTDSCDNKKSESENSGEGKVDLSDEVDMVSCEQLSDLERHAHSLSNSSNIREGTTKSTLAELVKNIESSSSAAVETKGTEEGKEAEGDRVLLNESQREIVRLSAEVAGSLSPDKFDISFNLDAFSPNVSSRIPQHFRRRLEEERVVIKDACKFLLNFMIPSFVKDCMQDISNVPVDSMQLTDALHSRGINMRYLSHIVTVCETQKEKHDSQMPNEDSIIASLDLLQRVVAMELLCRSAKHVFKRYMQSVQSHFLSDGVALFLNCLVGAYKEPKLLVLAEEEEYSRILFKSNHQTTNNNTLFGQQQNKKNKKKKSSQRHVSGAASSSSLLPSPLQEHVHAPPLYSSAVGGMTGIGSWMHLSPTQLWRQIKTDLKDYFYFQLRGDCIEEVCGQYGVLQCSLLRTLCSKVGVQLKLRNYDFLSTISPTFRSSDILNLFPIVKHVLPKANEGLKLLNKGQHCIQQGLLRPGCELITESLHLLNHVYGPIHSEIALCLKLLAHLNYILGDPLEAISHQHKAIMMYERCGGYDCMQTTSEYLRMALYCFCSEQPHSALYLLHRARYLMCVATGEDHPEVATVDTNIGLVLHSLQKFDQALLFLHNALTLNERHSGAMSLKTALSHHLKACVASCQGDFRSALQYEKEAFNIYKTELGEENEKTRESSELLKHLTSQAVALQRKINQFSKSASASLANAALPALFITQPTHKGVLEMLNVINGFFFFHLKKEDSEDEILSEVSKGGKSGARRTSCDKKQKSTAPSSSGRKNSSENSSQLSANCKTAQVVVEHSQDNGDAGHQTLPWTKSGDGCGGVSSDDQIHHKSDNVITTEAEVSTSSGGGERAMSSSRGSNVSESRKETEDHCSSGGDHDSSSGEHHVTAEPLD